MTETGGHVEIPILWIENNALRTHVFTAIVWTFSNRHGRHKLVRARVQDRHSYLTDLRQSPKVTLTDEGLC